MIQQEVVIKQLRSAEQVVRSEYQVRNILQYQAR